jgi:hypothetical protein
MHIFFTNSPKIISLAKFYDFLKLLDELSYPVLRLTNGRKSKSIHSLDTGAPFVYIRNLRRVLGVYSNVCLCSILDRRSQCKFKMFPGRFKEFQNTVFVYRHFNYLYSAESFND